jgi:hypothetical protein
MSENIEGAAARRVASGSGKSSGAIAGIAGYLLGRGRGKGKGKKSGSSKSAEDFHNEEIAKRYDFERNIQQTKLDESVRNAEYTRNQGAKNNKFIRRTAAAGEASKIKKSELRTAAGTAKRTGISRLDMGADGGFSLSMFDRPDTPASPSKTIRPPKSTVPKGKQFSEPAPAAPAAPAKPRGGTAKPKGGTSPAAGSGDISITGFPHRA